MKDHLISLLRKTEKYTKTDMVYLASGTLWANLNSAFITIVAFVASVAFARYLPKDIYGNYQYVLSIASILSALTLTGMSSAVSRAAAKGHEGEFIPAVKYQIKAGLLPLLASVIISTWYLVAGNNQLALAFITIGLFMPMSSALNMWAAYLGGKRIFRVGMYYSMTSTIITYGAVLAAVYFLRNFYWIVFANFFFQFIANFLLYKLTLKKFPPNTVRDDQTIKYGVHLSAMGIIGLIIGQLDSLLVFHFLGSATLAVYSFATLIPERIAGLLKFIPNLALPKLAIRSEEEVRQIILKRIWIIVSIVIFVVLTYSLSSPWIFKTFFPYYSESIAFTQVYSLSFFSLVASVLYTALTSQKRTRSLYLVNTAVPIIKALFMTVLMFYFGIWGLLWSQIVTNFASIAIQFTLVARKRR